MRRINGKGRFWIVGIVLLGAANLPLRNGDRVSVVFLVLAVAFLVIGVAIAKKQRANRDRRADAQVFRLSRSQKIEPVPDYLNAMKNASATFLALVMFVGFSCHLLADEVSTSLSTSLNERCIKCHGQAGRIEGKVNLLGRKGSVEISARPELLVRLIKVLKDRQMPPEDEPHIPEGIRVQMIADIEAILKPAIESLAFEPVPIRRMNRLQYNNAVVDLLELERDIFQLNERLLRRRQDYFRPETRQMPAEVRVSSRPLSKDIDNERPEGFRGVAAFPQDKRAEHGFDNRADHLTLSPLLMESFLKLSQSIVDSADLNATECRCWDRLFASPQQPLESATKAVAHSDVIRARLEKLLRRAFRRPVDSETRDRFTKFAERQLASGASFEDMMRSVVGAVIGMPDFLYYFETSDAEHPDGTAAGRLRISNFELASRLAHFFWSSIPDDMLLDLAESGKLSDPMTLSAQIDRMLNDRRSSRFCDNFPAQWLQLERLITSIPDPKMFPYFYDADGYRNSMHMMSEPLLLFETIYIEDRSIIELLDPKFTWQSEMLRANYEGQAHSRRDVAVQIFKRYPLDDPRWGGVITNAAVMTMTSTPTRTQPITRGAWVNAVIFNDPPQPPPADVPPLPEADAEELAKLTIRERLSEHRKRADCASCHNKLDPLGFALENFGPTGVWREKYENGRDVDSSGVLFSQYEFTSVVEFKRLILQEKQRFIRGLVSHLLSYALGRELGIADSPALDEITSRAMAGEDQLRVVLKSVAMSDPFLHKNMNGSGVMNKMPGHTSDNNR